MQSCTVTRVVVVAVVVVVAAVVVVVAVVVRIVAVEAIAVAAVGGGVALLMLFMADCKQAPTWPWLQKCCRHFRVFGLGLGSRRAC